MAEFRTSIGAFNAVMNILDRVPTNIAKAVKKDAEALTPVVTGRLRDGFELKESSGLGSDATVINEVPYAGFIEFGTENIQPRAMVGQAVIKVSADARKYLRNR